MVVEAVDALQAVGTLEPVARGLDTPLAQAEGCSVVTDYAGHGIGREMHLPPHVPHVGQPCTGPRLVPGLALTIEPMVNLGGPAVRTLSDGWTVVTEDGCLSAKFEHTLLFTDTDVEVLTRR